MAIKIPKIHIGFSKDAIRHMLGGALIMPPKKYWIWFLFFFSVLFLATIIFTVFIFISLNSKSNLKISESDDVSGVTINVRGLEEAAQALEKREVDFEKAIQEPLFRDPSI